MRHGFDARLTIPIEYRWAELEPRHHCVAVVVALVGGQARAVVVVVVVARFWKIHLCHAANRPS